MLVKGVALRVLDVRILREFAQKTGLPHLRKSGLYSGKIHIGVFANAQEGL